MHARLNIRQVLPGKLDELLSTFEETVAPDVRRRPGFKGSFLLTDRDTGKAISLTLWESEETMRRGREQGPFARRLCRDRTSSGRCGVRGALQSASE